MFRRRAIEYGHESSGFASVCTQRVRLRAWRGRLKRRDSGVATRSHISTRPRRLSRPRPSRGQGRARSSATSSTDTANFAKAVTASTSGCRRPQIAPSQSLHNDRSS
ncbi:unnamed protein product [Pieris macdunnoughi]|uniref:Uncharacterized protein n=1 Tax=Pieris macdunnoughi TaxID=345717 RepID=A0A821SRN8_9NEOP|nr:unnamed protein product [Pieris macdunnoughi]